MNPDVGEPARDSLQALTTRNAALLALAFGANMVLVFLGTSMTATYLGIEAFGSLSLALTVTSIIGLARSGVATTITKLAAAGHYGDAALVRSGTLLQSVVAVALGALVIPVVLVADGSWRLLVPVTLMAAALVVQSVYEVRLALYAGKDRMAWQLATPFAMALTIIVAWGLFTSTGWGLTAWPTAMLVAACAVALPVSIMARARYTNTASGELRISDLLTQAAALSGIALIQQVHWNLAVPLVRVMATPVDLGFFAAGTRFVPPIRTFAVIITMATLPSLARAIGNDVVVRGLVTTGARRLAILGCVVSLCVFGFADAIVAALYPAEFSSATEVLRISSLSFVPILLQWAFLNVLWLSGFWLPLASCYVASITLQVTLGYFVVPTFGAAGAAWIFVLCEAVAAFGMAVAALVLTRSAAWRDLVAITVPAVAGTAVVVVGHELGIAQVTVAVAVLVLFATARLTGAICSTDLQAVSRIFSHLSKRPA
jgi:O-antigen/teichoic acid export membrane protein